MPTIPGALLNFLPGSFTDANGAPLAGGTVQFYVTGTSTPKSVYAASDLAVPLTNPVVLDGTGRATIFLASGGYDAVVSDVNAVELYTVVGFQDVGLTFLNTLGKTLSTGAAAVTSGYVVLSTDQFVYVQSTGGADPCVINLPTASTRGLPLGIKNIGTIELEITPNGSDSIETSADPYTVPAAAPPLCPSIWLVPNAAGSGWWILASHGF